MRYPGKEIPLREVGVIFRGRVNDILLCADRDAQAGALYTALLVKEHETVKKLLALFKTGERLPGIQSCSEGYLFLFPHVRERSLSGFYPGREAPLPDCEEICRNLILACMSAELPYPFLYLVLDQGQVHLSRDNSIELGYAVDLEGLDPGCTKEKCVTRCALLLRDLLKSSLPDGKSAYSQTLFYPLLRKKLPRKAWHDFRELYSDMAKASLRVRKKRLLYPVKNWVREHQSGLFRLLLFLSALLTAAVLVMLISDLILGDIPLLRLFVNTFERIGTESLLK